MRNGKMKKDRVIKITDTESADGETESVELYTKGSLKMTDGICRLDFTETFDEENECKTCITVEKSGCVSLVREGAYHSELIVEQGKRHICQYITPYGELMVGIFGKSVENDVGKNGGSLKMKYTVDFFGGLAAEKEMTIDVSAQESTNEFFS